MKIKDALVRRNFQDKILIGDVVRKALSGRFGHIFRAYIDGMITKEIQYNKTNPNDRMPLSSDRILGRVEAYQDCLYGLEQMIQEADELKEPIREEVRRSVMSADDDYYETGE